MLPADLLAATLTRLSVGDKPLTPASQDKQNPQGALKLEIGQQVQGTVQAKVAGDVFQVKVAQQTVQMQLPAFVKSGDIVGLQVVSLQPRLTFSLAASINPLSTSEHLSSASRLLSSMSQQPVRQDNVQTSRQPPLWIGERGTPDTPQLAGKLHQALSHSGLFYESHQAQWVAGTRNTPQLLQEPQNLLRTQMPHPPQQATQQTAATQTTLSATSQSAIPPGTTEHAATPRMASIPEHLQPIVQQQLHALENKQVIWHGQAWDRQDMRWEVREETARRDSDGEVEKQWVTEVHLDLPTLGGVTARLSMKGDAVSLNFEVDDAQTANKLDLASAQLVSALTAHGVPVLQTQIQRKNAQPS